MEWQMWQDLGSRVAFMSRAPCQITAASNGTGAARAEPLVILIVPLGEQI